VRRAGIWGLLSGRLSLDDLIVRTSAGARAFLLIQINGPGGQAKDRIGHSTVS
jgi:hypothetical protein